MRKTAPQFLHDTSRDELISQLEMGGSVAAHTIEQLEIRNGELEENMRRLSDFYSHAPVAFLTFDFLARLVKVNPAAEALLGVKAEAVQGLSLTLLVADSHCQRFLDHLRRCRRAKAETVSTELELVRRGGETISVQLVSCRIKMGRREVFETAVIDLSEHKRTAAALKRAWEYAEAIVLGLPYPVLVMDDHARIVSANRAFFQILHTNEEQVRNWTFSQLPDVHWSTPGIETTMLQSVLREGKEINEMEINAILRAGGSLILTLSARRLRPGAGLAPMLLVCFEDITKRKRIEQEREGLVVQLEEARVELEARVEERTIQLARSLERLREVSEQLVLAHESEQRRIARELHDQVGQDLTALRLIFNRAAKDETNAARQTFQEAEKVVEEAIQNVRNICGTLRPQMLDDLGLVAALTWHFKSFGERSNLNISFEHHGVDETRLTPILQSAIFRVIQEALTNMARHAKTDRATVVLWMTDTDVLFRIQDRGCGFDMNTLRGGSTGLSSMRERISLVNGECNIKSAPGRGTIVQVQIPISSPPQPTHTNHDQNYRRGRSQPRSQGADLSART